MAGLDNTISGGGAPPTPAPSMSWRRWKRGLLVAMLTGCMTGIISLAIGTSWEQALILLAVSVAKDTLLWLKTHPVENLGPDTNILTK
jgi:hypothetical protein